MMDVQYKHTYLGANILCSTSSYNTFNFCVVYVYLFSDEEDEDECKGCDKEQEECVCKDILDNFHTINRQL